MKKEKHQPHIPHTCPIPILLGALRQVKADWGKKSEEDRTLVKGPVDELEQSQKKDEIHSKSEIIFKTKKGD